MLNERRERVFERTAVFYSQPSEGPPEFFAKMETRQPGFSSPRGELKGDHPVCRRFLLFSLPPSITGEKKPTAVDVRWMEADLLEANPHRLLNTGGFVRGGGDYL